MTQVKILGAGSIGNHLAFACRELGWAVTLCDIDPAALRRTREEIYPGRYGEWDEAIQLADARTLDDDVFDVVIIGTPPDQHIPLALTELASAAPRLLLLEKPLCGPGMHGCDRLEALATAHGTRLLVGYNHRLTAHTRLAVEWLADARLGPVTTLRALFREHWGGIFAAHPWLSGPHDTYLGFTERGGGALGEHSHAINIWQYFAGLTGQGRIVEVSAMLDEVRADGAAYDRIAQLSVRTESGLLGTIVQDVVTRPAQKWLRLEAENGFLEWQVNAGPDHDLVRLAEHGLPERVQRVAKSRPDDFRGEIAHLAALLDDPALESPLSLRAGLDTMRIIAAALVSARQQSVVRVDYAPSATAA